VQKLTLRHSAWYDDREITLQFPVSWQVVRHSLPERTALTESEQRERLEPFVDRLLAGRDPGALSVAAVVDDISRPTQVGPVLEIVLGRMQQAGVDAGRMTVVTAGGTHVPMSETLLRRKLGDAVCDRYRVQAHNPYKDLVARGRTGRGTPILVNRVVAEADLKLGIGGVFPHSPAGFSGGAKIMLGVAGFKTIARVHYRARGTTLGGSVDNPFRGELVEVARSVGLDASISLAMNTRRETVEIFAGDLIEAHGRAVGEYAKLHRVPPPGEADIVIACTYPFDTALVYSKKGWWPVTSARPGASGVVVGSYPSGAGWHGLHPMTRSRGEFLKHKLFVATQLPMSNLWRMAAGRFSRTRAAHAGGQAEPAERILFRPDSSGEIDPSYGVKFETDWSQLVERLVRKHGDGPLKVAVYDSAPLQYPDPESSEVRR